MIIRDVHFYYFLLVQFSCTKKMIMLSLHPRQILEMGGEEIITWFKGSVFKGIVCEIH